MLFKSNVLCLGEKKKKREKLGIVRIWVVFFISKVQKNLRQVEITRYCSSSPLPPFFHSFSCSNVLAACFPFEELVQVQRVSSE